MSGLISRILIVVACAGVIALGSREPQPFTTGDSRLILPRPTLLKALGKSHLQLVTDFYWLRSLNRATTAKTPADGKALLDLGWLITALDPDLRPAYWVVALNATISPDNAGDVWPNAPEAAQLIERGVERLPEENKLTIVLAQTYLAYMHDKVRAAQALRRRSQLPGALPYFAPLATRLLAAAGKYEASRELARVMLATATDDDTKKLFQERLMLIDQEEQLAKVDEAARRYREAHGEQIIDVATLLREGYLAEPPVDPFGGAIVIKEGRAYSTAIKRLEYHE